MTDKEASSLPPDMGTPPVLGDTTEDQNVFYNVLPKQRASGPLVNSAGAALGNIAAPSSSAGTETNLASSGTGKPALPRRAILAGLVIILILILGAGGYLLYSRSRSAPAPETPPAAVPPPEPTPPPTPPAQVPGVTTPSEWQKQYFANESCQTVSTCGDQADPDHDGLVNIEEYSFSTDPNNADSDGDGLADGDEVHVFGGSPLNQKTANDPTYDDADNASGGYNPTTNKKYTDEELVQVKIKIKQYSLHQPTISTLGENALTKYDFVEGSGGAPNPVLPSSLDRSPQAMLDRDTQRLSTIRKIGAALIQYKADKKTFPKSTTFLAMAAEIKPYLTVATNPVDPVNIAPFVYTYQVSQTALDFTITYYSESQNQLIKYTAPDAEKSSTLEDANLNDDQRVRDLENIKSALLIYSEANRPVNATVSYVFPPVATYKTELVPKYLSAIPLDPKTGKDYVYTVSSQFDSFSLKAILENPPSGTTGLQCTQEACNNY